MYCYHALRSLGEVGPEWEFEVNVWVIRKLCVETSQRLPHLTSARLDRGVTPLPPLPSHQPSFAGRRADAKATAEGLADTVWL